MPILDHWELPLTTDEILQAQGVDPESIRARRPGLVTHIEQSISTGKHFLHPLVLYEKYPIKKLVHERLELINQDSAGKTYLSGELIAQHLSRATELIIILCTIGSELDNYVSSLFRSDPMSAIAMDGMGSAAVEKLAIQACNYFEERVNMEGLKTSMPLNPGMVGWPVEEGQPQVFSLLDGDQIQVSLTDSCMMVPNKSLSMVLGIGEDMSAVGSTCDYCSLKGICKYQNHYAK